MINEHITEDPPEALKPLLDRRAEQVAYIGKLAVILAQVSAEYNTAICSLIEINMQIEQTSIDET